eukprot:CAMPEP_0172482430 /NCGR_PEP_ID=MMETSP1066-20121228/8824_1 /TAXON_ID=671091 /ORGANISM="Coscinodiscus wailesii, Strain CCMP2513" /LENGTH=103 /DNA_ID=CAMNT_0013245527 /DNA_START=61 /DNA_END=369 /DNA_ORIENTATION=+
MYFATASRVLLRSATQTISRNGVRSLSTQAGVIAGLSSGNVTLSRASCYPSYIKKEQWPKIKIKTSPKSTLSKTSSSTIPERDQYNVSKTITGADACAQAGID